MHHEFFKIYGCEKGKIGIKKIRTLKVKCIPRANKSILLRVMKNIVLKVAHSFLPKDYKQLLFEVMENLSYPSRLLKAILECLGKCRFRSMEKRFVRCLVMGIFGGDDGRVMIKKDATKNQEMEEDDVEEYGTDSGGESTEGVVKARKEKVLPAGGGLREVRAVFD